MNIEDDHAWLFHNPADYALMVRLADYCEAKGLSQAQFDELYAAVIKNDDVGELVFNLLRDLTSNQPNAEANAARKESAEADAGSIKELYKFLTEDEGKSRTEAIAELELSLNFSNSKINTAIKDIADGKRDEREVRKRWIWWDYGPCLAEHKGNKSATLRELADRHDLSVSTVKRIISDKHHLANYMINERPNHSWVPHDKTFKDGFKVWSGRLGDLCRDYRKAVREAAASEGLTEPTGPYWESEGSLYHEKPEKFLEIQHSIRKKYGFRLEQLEQLLEMYPRKLVYRDHEKGLDNNKLCERYGLTQGELKALLEDAYTIAHDTSYNVEVDAEESGATILQFDETELEDRLAKPEDGPDDDLDEEEDYEDLDEGFDEDD